MVARVVWDHDAGGSSPSLATISILRTASSAVLFIMRRDSPVRLKWQGDMLFQWL